MKDLEQLKQQILTEVEEESQKNLTVAIKKQEEQINTANTTLATQEIAKKTAMKQLYKTQWEKEKQALVNQSKIEILQVKRELLNRVFEEVLAVMTSWSGETLVSFIEAAVQQLSSEQEIQLILGEYSQSQLSDTDKSRLAEHVRLVDEVISQKAGFVLRQDGIEYNYLFDALMADLQQEYSPELARKAFQA